MVSAFLLTTCLMSGQAQRRNEIQVPDLDGYTTLKCDFHMHSVFSDGLVWPTVRVDEAYRDGLDAISLTEHIEYRLTNRMLFRIITVRSTFVGNKLRSWGYF